MALFTVIGWTFMIRKIEKHQSRISTGNFH